MHVLLSVVAFLLLLVIYFVPTMVARSRNHINATAIFVANLLLGWTVLGWAIAMVWAFTITPVSVTPITAPQKNTGAGGFLKGLLIVVGALVLLVVLVGIFGNHGPHAGQGSYTSAPATPAAPSGVPVPADEILGK